MPKLLDIIARCKKMEKRSQRSLYELYAPVLMGIAMRYGKSRSDAEDILQEAFVKIFLRIDQYSETGSFEGWMKKILVNTAISYYRKNNKYFFHVDYSEIEERKPDESTIGDSEYTRDELFMAINSLPDGFRVVFNMHAVEGYKHREIAASLGIEIGTSKSQYYRARIMLQERLLAVKKIRVSKEYE